MPVTRTHVCNYCEKQYRTTKDLSLHIAAVHERRKRVVYPPEITFSLPDDNLILRSATQLTHSLVPTNEPDRPYHCDLCERAFGKSSDLKRHFDAVHLGLKPNKCPICFKCFAQKGQLKPHMNSHTGETPYICDECGASFGDPSSCTRHRNEQHGTGFRHVCFIAGCMKGFNRPGVLRKHQESCHGIAILHTPPSNPKARSRRPRRSSILNKSANSLFSDLLEGFTYTPSPSPNPDIWSAYINETPTPSTSYTTSSSPSPPSDFINTPSQILVESFGYSVPRSWNYVKSSTGSCAEEYTFSFGDGARTVNPRDLTLDLLSSSEIYSY